MVIILIQSSLIIENARVMVLAATNRPSELDEAILRRFSQCFKVDRPDANDREKILKVILKDERVDDNIDLKYIASLCEGCTGSDILELCKQAAYTPLREYLEAERSGIRCQVCISVAHGTRYCLGDQAFSIFYIEFTCYAEVFLILVLFPSLHLFLHLSRDQDL